MKKYITIVAIIACLGCDNSEDYLNSLNNRPTVDIYGLNDSGSMIEDSIKLSGDVGLFFYDLGLKVTDLNRNISEVEIDGSGNQNLFIVQSDSILVDVKFVDINDTKDSISVEIAVFATGRHKIDFIANDVFGKNSKATIYLNVFENLAPVVKHEIHDNELSPTVKEIDLTKSYDQDVRFGGTIILYNYELDGKKIASSSSSLLYSFPSVGVYPVTVYVTDNNIIDSPRSTFNITVTEK